MSLILFGMILGAIYGRNAGIINERLSADARKVWRGFARTGAALNLYMVADAIYERLANLHKREVVYNHDLLCTCNRRSCRPLKINTYVRRIKAAS